MSELISPDNPNQYVAHRLSELITSLEPNDGLGALASASYLVDQTEATYNSVNLLAATHNIVAYQKRLDDPLAGADANLFEKGFAKVYAAHAKTRQSESRAGALIAATAYQLESGLAIEPDSVYDNFDRSFYLLGPLRRIVHRDKLFNYCRQVIRQPASSNAELTGARIAHQVLRKHTHNPALNLFSLMIGRECQKAINVRKELDTSQADIIAKSKQIIQNDTL